jgi:Skp family chaperone for outer membrane proteins
MKSMCAAMAIALMSTLAVGVSNSASAQETAAGGYKIAVVDVQRVLAEYGKRKAKYDELQAKVNSLQVEVDALSNSIEAKKKSYEEKRQAGAAPTELNGIEATIKQELATYELKLKENQNTIDTMEKAVLTEVVGDVEKAIDEIGTSGNYHIILNARKDSGGAVLYYAAPLDITQSVLSKLNGGSSAAPAAAPAPAADGDGKKKKKND